MRTAAGGVRAVAIPAPIPAPVTAADIPAGEAEDAAHDHAPVMQDDRPSRVRLLLWLALAACPSLLLSATTNQMCQEVAPVPFLWILPLALYLLSFVICFAGPRWYWPWLWQPALVLSMGAVYVVLQQGVSATFMSQIVVFPLVLFAAAMVCHGELVRLRPSPSHLTAFYLTIAAGGAIGSATVALVAPRIFDGFWELQIGLLDHRRADHCRARVGPSLVALPPRPMARPPDGGASWSSRGRAGRRGMGRREGRRARMARRASPAPGPRRRARAARMAGAPVEARRIPPGLDAAVDVPSSSRRWGLSAASSSRASYRAGRPRLR